MRIKCPNSDIVLELPGDRTDMKFTCPACHLVHRVTVSITTPGANAPSGGQSGAKASAAQPPQMPKKYATGAYAPVVDIPIDANFVLVDNASSPFQSGIDLGAAARPEPVAEPEDTPPPVAEVVSDPDDDPEKTAGPDDIAPGRHLWDDAVEAAPPPHARPAAATPPPATPAEPRQEYAAYNTPERRGGGGGRALLVFLLLVLLAAAGFMGYQQYRYNRTRDDVNNLLRWADSAWSKGEVRTAADHAREAETMLHTGDVLLTPKAVWNRLAEWSGLLPVWSAGNGETEEKIQGHLSREREFDAFRNDATPGDAAGLAALLRRRAAAPGVDPALRRAMESEVIASVMEDLGAAAPGLTPEEARARARRDGAALLPALSPGTKRDLENQLSAFADAQRRRLVDEVRAAAAAIAREAAEGQDGALERYRELAARVRGADIPELSGTLVSMAEEQDRETIQQLDELSRIVDAAVMSARTVLTRPDGDDGMMDDFIARAGQYAAPNAGMVDAAVRLIDDAGTEEEDLLNLRAELFDRLQSEMRRNRDNPGTRLAWSMMRAAFDDPAFAIDPSSFRYDTDSAEMSFTMNGLPAAMKMLSADADTRLSARLGDYRFTSGWAVLFHKPLSWMARLAADMSQAGVDPAAYPVWEVLEGPGRPLALSVPGAASGTALGSQETAAGRRVFYDNRLHDVRELAVPAEAEEYAGDFRAAAKRLEEAVMADESVSTALRQALKPILTGTYQPPDAKDYFDSAFCRRLIEADYLERALRPMPEGVREALRDYRLALGKLEAGVDEFAVDLDDGGTLVAVRRSDADFSGEGKASDQDPETGETFPRLTWRIEQADKTVFFSPQPSRFVYALMLAEHYDGRHTSRPAGVPGLTEIWHTERGRLAWYRDGDRTASGDTELWNAAIEDDSSGRFDPTTGPPGWNYPLHVLQRDGQGDPVLLATLNGVLESPDFTAYTDDNERRDAEDDWLDRTAEVLSEPGELGLIFHQFFRYCSDSPLPELPNLIGSHFGLSDTHQTVYESLERRWVGRLIGDCDDLAEFFQVLTRRQGKLSHVMQLPGHAAAGYVEPIEGGDGGYRFVVLQTGPVMQFTAPTLNEVVEIAYRSFDRGEGMSHLTADAVPLLLRFANEETRTPFVLSARIFADAQYAETMIQVQAYWHENVYSAALRVMEKMVAEDKEIGNIKELGSLYERVGDYERSAELRRRELALVLGNSAASLSTLLEIAQLHIQDKDRDSALRALDEMEAIMLRMIEEDDAPEFFRAMSFRSFWALHLARLGQPDRAWRLVRYDATMTKRSLGRIAEQILRTMVALYDGMCVIRDSGQTMTAEAEAAMAEVRRELSDAFGRGYFQDDDSYNTIIGRYFVLGRFAVSDAGRDSGLARLSADGPYPAAEREHTRRTRGVDEADWEWLRITPQLYLALGMEMLDRDEYPELYDPAGAKPILEDVKRAVDKGTGLGSDVSGSEDAVKAELTLSFLNNDLGAFRRAMRTVKERNYSGLYDEAALTFGLHCGLVPLADFPAWTEAFHEFFPGSQHYFKVVYRAIDKEHYDHALVMAEATALFFPDRQLLQEETEFIRSIVPGLKARKAARTGEYASAPAA